MSLLVVSLFLPTTGSSEELPKEIWLPTFAMAALKCAEFSSEGYDQPEETDRLMQLASDTFSSLQEAVDSGRVSPTELQGFHPFSEDLFADPMDARLIYRRFIEIISDDAEMDLVAELKAMSPINIRGIAAMNLYDDGNCRFLTEVPK